jgi:hypothetical protein
MHLHTEINIATLSNLTTATNAIKSYGGKRFMDNIPKYLTLVEPTKVKGKYSPLSIFKKLNDEAYIESNMGNISSMWLKKLYKFLYDAPRSNFLPKVAVPGMGLYSSAVPYPLYAYKSQYNVKYSEWNLDEGTFPGQEFGPGNLMLSYGHKEYYSNKETFDAHFQKPKPPANWVPDWWVAKYGSEVPFEGDVDQAYSPSWVSPVIDWAEVRKQYLVHATKKTPIAETAHAKGTYTCNPLLAKFSNLYRHMLTQTWVYAPSIRSEHMIHSFEDIDLMPELFEVPTSIVEEVVVPKHTKVKNYLDLGSEVITF